ALRVGRAQGLLARAHRLDLHPRRPGPRPVRDRPDETAALAGGQRAVPALGDHRPDPPGRRRRAVLDDLERGVARVHLGRAGPDLPRPPRHVERELDRPPVGQPAVQEPRREPQQLPRRRAGAGRGVAQQPPRVPDQRPPRAAVVADRRQLLRDQGDGLVQAGLEGEAPVAAGDGGEAAGV
ncbi:MAG: Fatty acid desaturase; Delta-9 fatty acid desaturase, partial [uncultured Phycisphaerae bacterium]